MQSANRSIRIMSILVPLFLLVGCASQDDMDALRLEVRQAIETANTAQKKAENAEAMASAAQASARAAESKAAAAAASANAAAQSAAAAQANSEKAERIFQKSLRK